MTTNLPLPLDFVMATMLVAISLGVLLARDLFQSIVLFIIFGLLLGIAWCRLEAVDVALAEVALGAGLTGALLLNTLSAAASSAGRQQISRPDRPVQYSHQEAQTHQNYPWVVRMSACVPAGLAMAAFVFVAVIIAGLTSVVFPLALVPPGSRIAVSEAMPHSGVSNPVTAVLLNFRAYDTLLEVAVLLAAVLAALVVSTIAAPTDAQPAHQVLRSFAGLLVPLAILVAVYVLWAGTKAPGGAFQAAAILGAASVLKIVCGGPSPSLERSGWRLLLIGGPMVFLLVGLGGIVAGGSFLELAPHWAGALIVLVEMTLTVSIALVLVLLFVSTQSSVSSNGIAGSREQIADDYVTAHDADDPQEPVA